MYLNNFEILLSVGGLMVLGVAMNEFARWVVNRKNKKVKFTDTLKKVKK